jgi:hypothetical protein
LNASEVAEDVFDPTGVDIIAVDLRRRLLEVPAAKPALVVREFDEDQPGALTALRGIPTNREHDVRDVSDRILATPEQRVDLLQLALKLKLALFKSLDFFLEVREIVSCDGRGIAIDQEHEDRENAMNGTGVDLRHPLPSHLKQRAL